MTVPDLAVYVGWHALSLRRACSRRGVQEHALRRLRACHPTSARGLAMVSSRFYSLVCGFVWLTSQAMAEPLPGTKPLVREGDLAAEMVAGIDRYLMAELAVSVDKRQAYWTPDYSSVEAYEKSV